MLAWALSMWLAGTASAGEIAQVELDPEDLFIGKSHRLLDGADTWLLDMQRALVLRPETHLDIVVTGGPDMADKRAARQSAKRALALSGLFEQLGVDESRIEIDPRGPAEDGPYVRMLLVDDEPEDDDATAEEPEEAAPLSAQPLSPGERSLQAVRVTVLPDQPGPMVASFAGGVGVSKADLLAVRSAEVSANTRWREGADGVAEGHASLQLDGVQACRAAALVSAAVTISRAPTASARVRLVCGGALSTVAIGQTVVVVRSIPADEQADVVVDAFRLFDE